MRLFSVNACIHTSDICFKRPEDVLGRTVGRMIEKIGYQSGSHYTLVIPMTISITSGMALGSRGRVVVGPKDMGWKATGSAWIWGVMDVGGGKTPAYEEIMRSFHSFESIVRMVASSSGLPGERMASMRLEDATIQFIIQELASTNCGTLFFIVPELSLLTSKMIHGEAATRGKNIANYCKLKDQTELSNSTVGGGRQEVESSNVIITGMMQPGPFHTFASNSDVAEVGLSHRIIAIHAKRFLPSGLYKSPESVRAARKEIESRRVAEDKEAYDLLDQAGRQQYDERQIAQDAAQAEILRFGAEVAMLKAETGHQSRSKRLKSTDDEKRKLMEEESQALKVRVEHSITSLTDASSAYFQKQLLSTKKRKPEVEPCPVESRSLTNDSVYEVAMAWAALFLHSRSTLMSCSEEDQDTAMQLRTVQTPSTGGSAGPSKERVSFENVLPAPSFAANVRIVAISDDGPDVPLEECSPSYQVAELFIRSVSMAIEALSPKGSKQKDLMALLTKMPNNMMAISATLMHLEFALDNPGLDFGGKMVPSLVPLSCIKAAINLVWMGLLQNIHATQNEEALQIVSKLPTVPEELLSTLILESPQLGLQTKFDDKDVRGDSVGDTVKKMIREVLVWESQNTKLKGALNSETRGVFGSIGSPSLSHVRTVIKANKKSSVHSNSIGIVPPLNVLKQARMLGKDPLVLGAYKLIKGLGASTISDKFSVKKVQSMMRLLTGKSLDLRRELMSGSADAKELANQIPDRDLSAILQLVGSGDPMELDEDEEGEGQDGEEGEGQAIGGGAGTSETTGKKVTEFYLKLLPTITVDKVGFVDEDEEEEHVEAQEKEFQQLVFLVTSLNVFGVSLAEFSSVSAQRLTKLSSERETRRATQLKLANRQVS